MELLQLLVDLHREGARQGPGGELETRKALDLAGLKGKSPLKVLDIGCGTGASTLVLAKELEAEITAVDFVPEFLEELERRAKDLGVERKIQVQQACMRALSFAPGTFDVLWSEGAIYNLGFEAGISAWSRFLKPGGKLVVSEITWLTGTRPLELQQHWEREYPQIAGAGHNIRLLEKQGYSPEAYFVLPDPCWLENYYLPLEGRFESFLARHGQSEPAQKLVEAEKKERALYTSHKAYYSYGMYVASKRTCE